MTPDVAERLRDLRARGVTDETIDLRCESRRERIISRGLDALGLHITAGVVDVWHCEWVISTTTRTVRGPSSSSRDVATAHDAAWRLLLEQLDADGEP